MDPFDLAQYFIEHCARANHIGDLSIAFQRNLEHLGFRYFACSSHVDPLNPEQGIMVLNYPQEWIECYSELQLHLIDPVFRRADLSRTPFHWDEALFLASMSRKQRKMQTLARHHGVAHGFTIPIHGPMYASSCSVIPDSLKLSPKSYLAVELMAHRLFDRITELQCLNLCPQQIIELSPREKQCLALVSHGKDDAAMGVLLGISKHTAHIYIQNAIKKTGLSTRTQVLMYALTTRQIRLEEVVRPLLRFVHQRRRDK
ncbi:LuxR family transcriptional regulator [Povalibacter sp.]|uniref:helix-turn-helix transcriptional regulator n=1 Tax=Povalibacter sp. TaxID=1962978 RepID=UPI002F420178